MHEELIERLEAFDGPSRELDAEIALALGWPRHQENGYVWAEHPVTGAATDGLHGPRWTESIDAALTLVPEGWGFGIFPGCAQLTHGPLLSIRIILGKAKTPALALCIAALRARAADGDGHEG